MASFNAGDIEAKITLDAAAFQTGLDEARRRADEFEGKTAKAKLGADITDVTTKVAEASAKVDEFGRKRASATLEVDRSGEARRALDDLGAKATADAGKVSHLTGSVSAFGGALKLSSTGSMGLITAMGGVTTQVGLAGAKLASLATVGAAGITPVLGLAGGLGSAFGAATAGLGAFAVLAGPSLYGVQQGLTNLFKAQQLFQTAQASGNTKQMAVQLALEKNALDSLTPAQRTAATAILGAKDALDKLSVSSGVGNQALHIVAGAANTVRQVLPELVPLAHAAGGALQTMAAQIESRLLSPAFRTQLAQFTQYTRGAILGIGNVLGNSFMAFGNAMGTLAPTIAPVLGMLGQLTGHLSTLANGPGLHQFAHVVASIMPALGSALSGIGNALTGLVKAAEPLAGPLLTAIGALGRALGSAFRSAGFTEFVHSLVRILPPLVPALSALASGIANVLGAVGSGVASAAPGILAGITSILTPVAHLVEALAPVLGPVGGLIATIGHAIGAALPFLTGMVNALNTMIGPVDMVLAALAPLVPILVSALAPAFTGIASIVRMLAPVIVTLIHAVSPLVVVLGQALAPIFKTIAAVVVALSPVLLTLVGAFGQILHALLPLLPALSQILVALLPIIPPLATLLIPAIKLLAIVLTPIAGLLAILARALADIITPVAAAITWVVKLVDAFLLSKTTWAAVGLFFITAFGAFEAYFKVVWLGISTLFTTTWHVIRDVAVTIWHVIDDFFHLALDVFFGRWGKVWGDIRKIFSDVWTGIKAVGMDIWNGIHSFFTGAFGAFEGFFKSTWNRIAGTFSGVWSSMASGVAGAWNSVKGYIVSGINDVIGVLDTFIHYLDDALGLFGLKIPSIPKVSGGGGGGGAGGAMNLNAPSSAGKLATIGRYAAGGVVNVPTAIVGEDGSGHPEYVIPTNPAHRQRALDLFSDLGTRLMAGGGILGGLEKVGSGVLGAIGGVAKAGAGVLVSGVYNLISPLLGQIPSPFGQMLRAILDEIRGGIAGWSSAHQPKSGPLPTGSHMSLIAQALQDAGVSANAANESAVNTIVTHESGWNPAAVNNWDSNAAAGHPSQGLMQTIPSTFAAYVPSGLSSLGILNPLANLAAGIRYAVSRYGSLTSVPGVAAVASGGGYVGYDSGGWLPSGRTVTLNATGRPEAVLTDEQWSTMARLAGHGQAAPNVQVFIDGQEFRGMVRTVVDGSLTSVLTAHRSGLRPGAVR